MVDVVVKKPHAKNEGIGVWAVGDTYRESPLVASQKAKLGFVDYLDPNVVRTKEDMDMYRTRTFSVPAKPPEPVTLVSRTYNWYNFSDGTKLLGKKAAAERLGVSVEELEAMDVDSDDN